ncbi:MAG TPA: hypothetical protein VH969_23565 [Actinophytocola sp.]|jgi:hypothetical protein|uniref:hypothetical protein n=1 Tax=Actinophytocola sp. TaxID=1872138 RepID=UPI002F940742
MTTTSPPKPVTVRRTGYVFGAGVNAAMLVLVNIWPGWAAVPFLNGDTPKVLLLVNLTIAAGLLTNLVLLFGDPPRLVALGGLLTSALGFAGLLRIWQVFPFDFGDADVDWALIFRIVLVVGIVGTCIGFGVQVATLITGSRK